MRNRLQPGNFAWRTQPQEYMREKEKEQDCAYASHLILENGFDLAAALANYKNLQIFMSNCQIVKPNFGNFRRLGHAFEDRQTGVASRRYPAFLGSFTIAGNIPQRMQADY